MKNLENKTQNIEIFCNPKLSFTHTHKEKRNRKLSKKIKKTIKTFCKYV